MSLTRFIPFLGVRIRVSVLFRGVGSTALWVGGIAARRQNDTLP